MQIDDGVVLPAAVDAAVRRKSAVGEPYIDMSPTPGTNPNVGARLTKGTTIGLDHTSTPLEYSELFKAAANLVRAVNPNDLQTLVHELATAVQGRGDSIRELLASTSKLSVDLSQHSEVVDQLITDLSQVASTLADHRDALGQSIDSVDAIAGALAQSQQDFADLVARGPTFTSTLADIVANSKSSLGCVLDGLGTVGSALDPPTVAALQHLISLSPQFAFVLQGLEKPNTGAGGYLFFNNGSGPPSESVPVFATPRPAPAVPTVPSCASLAAAPSAPPANGAGASTAPVAPPPGGETVPVSPRAPTAAQAAEASSRKRPGSDEFETIARVLALLLAALVLAALAWRFVAHRRRREDGLDA
jgi:phospholipid/cholesterol/gamma-HCH transport system substrate-binding protein